LLNMAAGTRVVSGNVVGSSGISFDSAIHEQGQRIEDLSTDGERGLSLSQMFRSVGNVKSLYKNIE